MPAFAVVTAFKGIDGISKPLGKMKKSAKAFDKASDRAFSRASKKATMFGSVLRGVLGAQVITGGINLLRNGISSVTDEFIDFDQAATNSAAKFKDGMEIGSAAYREMKKAARDVGATTKFTAAEAQKGIEFLAMAGFKGAQAIAAIAPAAELATAGNLDLARSTDISSDVLSAFGLRVDDTNKLLGNMARVNNVLSRTVNSANTDMEGLFETIKFGGPAASAAGQDLETVAALAGAMGDSMIKNSMAGTTMRTMFTSLAKPAREARTLIKKLNLQIVDEKGNFNDAMAIIGDFNRATKDMGERQRLAAIKVIFGKRAISGMKALLDKGEVSLRKYREEQIRVGKTASEVAKEMNKGLEFRLKTLRSAAIEVGFKFIDVFSKKIPGVIDSATNAVRNFDVKKVIDQVHKFGLFIERVIGLVKDLSPLIWGVVAAYTAYRAILIGVMAIQAIRFFAALVTTIRAATASQTLLNLAMTANPIGVIVVGIGLLVAAIVLIYKNWDIVSEVMQEFWIDFKTVLGKMWDWFVKMLDNPFFSGIMRLLNPLLEIPAMIIRNWEPIKAFFREVYDVIKPIIDLTEKGIAAAAEFLGVGADKKIGIEKSIRTSSEDNRKSPRKSPNEKELASKSQIDFQGKLMFGNAPPGATVEGETRGAPPIDLQMSGQN